ncbi:MAG: DHH family phosphoesterase, partial [Bacteroidales bacterium]|nr:DHH family phosphoesterase [Bacteroidales bacterium]
MDAREKNWVIKPQGDPASVMTLASELGIDTVLSELLVQRGVTNFEEARSFFRPSLQDLHDPFLMKDMDKAIDRITKAIENKEKILVYGDYDVDGTTAVALVVSFLRKIATTIGYYIPDRYDEGYGVSFKGIDKAQAQGYTLIITLDCGIKAVEKTEYAKTKGIDMIICDHHLPDEKIPDAVAVLDPKREDCNYPFDDLSGCGV